MKISLDLIKLFCILLTTLAPFMVSSAPHLSCQTNQVAKNVIQQRDLFNKAISNADLTTIASILSDSVTLVTGSNSDLFKGKQAQLDIWQSDFEKGDEREVYHRTTDCISISDLGSMAMEYGKWRGFRDQTTLYSGSYSAKWRFDDVSQSWLLEAEIFMTNYTKYP